MVKMKTPSVKMKTSSAMKDSGIEWIGEIPEHWGVRRCKNLTTFINGYSFKTEELQQDFIYPVIRIGDIKNGRIEFDSCLGVNSNLLISQYKIKKDDILVAMSGATVGKIGIITEDLDAYINQRVGIIRLDYPQFLYYCLLTKDFIEYILITETSSAQPNMSKRDLDEFKIPFPPIEEQRLIAVQLNQICGTLDNTKADIENQIEILNEYKKSVITEAVTKGLDKNVELKDSGIDWIGEVPEHWDIIKGKYILNLLKKNIKETDDVVTCFRDGEVTLRKNRREEGFTISEKEIGYQGIDIGDLVVHGMDGFAGAIGISDSRGKGSPVLNVLDSSQNKKYLMYFLRDLAYKDIFLATATGIRVRSCDLRWNKLAVLEFSIPPIEEQQEIVTYLDSKCSEIDSIIETKKQQLELLEEYKKSIIYEYVTGKREVLAPLGGVSSPLDEVSAKPDFAVAQNTQSVSIE